MTHGGPHRASPPDDSGAARSAEAGRRAGSMPEGERGPAVTDPTQVRRRPRRFGPLGLAIAGAGGFLAGILLVAILGGAQPVYK